MHVKEKFEFADSLKIVNMDICNFIEKAKMYRLIVFMLCMMCTVSSFAQELTVKSFGVISGDLDARTNERVDANKMPCGLVKVQLAAPGATFDATGFVIGNVERRGSEYWVYMSQGSYLLQVDCPGYLPLKINLHDYGLKDGIQGKVTYSLVIVRPDTPAAPKTQKLIINYTPANALVLVDSKPYQGNGHVEIPLSVGSHEYQIVAMGYVTAEGTVKLSAEAPRTITETLVPSSDNQAIAAKNPQPSTPVSSTIQTSNTPSSDGIETFTVNGVTFNMVRVDGGTFRMGSNDSEADSDEKRVHQVTLSGYSIGETEVTQALWEAVMGSNPSNQKGSTLPVEQVSWEDCQKFITRLNQKTGRTFRLSTEAEWEFAARGGNKSKGYKYSGSNTLDNVGWYWKNSGDRYLSGTDSDWDRDQIKTNNCRTHPVKTKSPNELGIYDMSGNVWEWCQDWYGYYSSSAQTNPSGPSSGSNRVNRGGSWYNSARSCRSSNRNYYTPASRISNLGLRLVL